MLTFELSITNKKHTYKDKDKLIVLLGELNTRFLKLNNARKAI